MMDGIGMPLGDPLDFNFIKESNNNDTESKDKPPTETNTAVENEYLNIAIYHRKMANAKRYKNILKQSFYQIGLKIENCNKENEVVEDKKGEKSD